MSEAIDLFFSVSNKFFNSFSRLLYALFFIYNILMPTVIFCMVRRVGEFFEKRAVGLAVRPNSIEDVVKAIEQIEKNYMQLTKTARIESLRFNWDECTSKFVEIYKEALH